MNLEGSGRGLFECVPTFSWRYWGKLGKSQPLNYIGLQAEILTPDLPTAKPLYWEWFLRNQFGPQGSWRWRHRVPGKRR